MSEAAYTGRASSWLHDQKAQKGIVEPTGAKVGAGRTVQDHSSETKSTIRFFNSQAGQSFGAMRNQFNEQMASTRSGAIANRIKDGAKNEAMALKDELVKAWNGKE